MRQISHESTYNNHALSYSRKNNQGSYIEILEGIESLLNYMTRQHPRVFFTMFVLHYPANSAHLYPNSNALLTRFLEAFTLHCKRRRYDPKYLWVRELSPKTGQIHYHFMLLLDSDYIQSTHSLLVKATELWQRCLNIEDGKGLVHLCKPDEYNKGRYGGGVKIKRNDPDFQQVLGECFQRASYLAKCYSKGQSPANVNGFGCSQLS